MDYEIISKHISKKIVDLPLADPPIKYLNRFYLPLAIAFNDKNAQEWFHSSFIQTKRLKKQNVWMIFYNNIPFVKTQRFTLYITKIIKPSTLIKKMIRLLQLGCFISIELDWNTIRCPNINTNAFPHDTIISGFNVEKREFILNGYNPFGRNISKVSISWDLFLKSFYKIKKSKIEIHRKKQTKKTFSYRLLKKGIKNYANSKISFDYLWATKSIAFPHNEDYGIDASYNYIQEQIKAFPDNPQKIESTILRIKGMEEWASAMVARLMFLKDFDKSINVSDTINIYNDILKKYRIMYSLLLKYLINKKSENIIKVHEMATECRKAEKEALNLIIKQF